MNRIGFILTSMLVALALDRALEVLQDDARRQALAEAISSLRSPPQAASSSASTTSRAVASPEKFCWPVIRLPSRRAKGLNRPAVTKLVPSIRLASSSIQKG